MPDIGTNARMDAKTDTRTDARIKAKVLVVGGAGYVGSATAAWLQSQGHSVWILDDLSTGHFELVLDPTRFTFGQAGNVALVKKLLAQQSFDCVMHFAAKSLVGESFQKRDEYFQNNVTQTRALLETLLEAGIKNFIFSSTCAIFGDPANGQKIDESTPIQPVTPYGETKVEVEKMLQSLALDRDLKAIALRYFNAAGAESSLRVGEWHEPESHLIPKVFKAALNNTPIEIYGTDYPTPDGTCVRDYIHISNLASAHEAAMIRLFASPQKGFFEAYNLGSENGSSVREVIRTCEKVTGKSISIVEQPKRPGDPSFLVASSENAKKVLGFKPNAYSLEETLASAWAWESQRGRRPRKAVFLDRDGTLNEDPGYLNNPDQLKLLPTVGEALALLKGAGFLLVVVSNQSGVARGLIHPDALPLIHQRLEDLLKPWAVRIDQYKLCLHHPKEDCECRKPKPTMILDAAREWNIDLKHSYMVGDKYSDLKVGAAAGCRHSILALTGDGKTTRTEMKPGEASFSGESLLQIAHWILDQENANS